jgi:hypothetical protein
MELIKKYYLLTDNQKYTLLQDLEFEVTEEKWDLYLEILNNPDESDDSYDTQAIQVLTILQIAEVPQKLEQEFINAISKILNTSDDDDIRNYSIILSKVFINKSDDLKNNIHSILKNKDEFITLRENALFSLMNLESKIEKKEILDSQFEDDDLKECVKYELNNFNKF